MGKKNQENLFPDDSLGDLILTGLFCTHDVSPRVYNVKIHAESMFIYIEKNAHKISHLMPYIHI